ncbi:MAG: hypothetical protein JWL75_301 [Parcubacteria group bacterium]|nr:hypothetical protein [Parcubacteria group bacterium]
MKLRPLVIGVLLSAASPTAVSAQSTIVIPSAPVLVHRSDLTPMPKLSDRALSHLCAVWTIGREDRLRANVSALKWARDVQNQIVLNDTIRDMSDELDVDTMCREYPGGWIVSEADVVVTPPPK